MNKFCTFLSVLLPGLAFAAPAAAGALEGAARDAWLEGRIVSAYAMNEHLSPFELDVEVRDGVAYISGTVDGETQKDLAEEIARDVDGIREVRAEIGVETDARARNVNVRGERSGFTEGVSDATVTASVKTQLLANANVGGLDINVDTQDGVVTLSGIVDSDAESDLAEKIAANVEGVREVRNRLSVAGD